MSATNKYTQRSTLTSLVNQAEHLSLDGQTLETTCEEVTGRYDTVPICAAFWGLEGSLNLLSDRLKSASVQDGVIDLSIQSVVAFGEALNKACLSAMAEIGTKEEGKQADLFFFKSKAFLLSLELKSIIKKIKLAAEEKGGEHG
jgi:hypothetical protein